MFQCLRTLEQRVQPLILSGVLGVSVLGSGCATPEDFMLGAAAAGLGGLSPNITPQQALVLGVTRDVAGMGAGVSAQRESSQRIAGAIQGQGVSGGQDSGTLRVYREGMKEYLLDDTQKIAYAQGLIAFGPYPNRPYNEVILAICNYFEDFKKDGLDPEDFVGTNNEFRRNEKINVVFCGNKRDPPARTKVFDSNGTLVEDSELSVGGYGPVITFFPGRLSSGNYAAVFYYQDQMIGKMEFRVKD